MSVTPYQYPLGVQGLLDGSIDLDTDTLKVAIVDSSFAYSATDQYWSDVSANEVAGTGYTAGGATITGAALSTSGDVVTFDANDVTWDPSTITGRAVVVYKDTGTPTTSPLIHAEVSSVDISSDSGTWTAGWSASGLFSVTANA